MKPATPSTYISHIIGEITNVKNDICSSDLDFFLQESHCACVLVPHVSIDEELGVEVRLVRERFEPVNCTPTVHGIATMIICGGNTQW